ncbi:MAG: GAF domain-containing protein [Okeania sp. SIO3B5]|nr:GAF domain-containing protein [Okeania sp. SIO3B5]
MTDSEYGFISEVIFQDDGKRVMGDTFLKIRGVPDLQTYTISNISWNPVNHKFYIENYKEGMEFSNINTLFRAVLMTGKAVIVNNTRADPDRGRTPDSYPPLNSFLGLPFFSSSTLVGIVVIANRPEGYDNSMIEALNPLLVTCGNLVEGYRLARQKKQAEAEIAQQLASIEAAVDGIAIIKNGFYQYVNRTNKTVENRSELLS